jgi:hypothetical protein
MYFLSDENREQTNFEAMFRQGEKTSDFPIQMERSLSKVMSQLKTRWKIMPCKHTFDNHM